MVRDKCWTTSNSATQSMCRNQNSYRKGTVRSGHQSLGLQSDCLQVPRSRPFVGFGDANPSNVSPLVRGAEMRVAETRAVNRALRRAYGVGLCSVEELGSFSAPQKPFAAAPHPNGHPGSSGSSNGQPRLRDKLCLLIRKYELDPNLVKRYAADFCGTESLRDAGRDLVEAFVSTVAEEAAKDRAALLCKLNSYSQPQEVSS